MLNINDITIRNIFMGYYFFVSSLSISIIVLYSFILVMFLFILHEDREPVHEIKIHLSILSIPYNIIFHVQNYQQIFCQICYSVAAGL